MTNTYAFRGQSARIWANATEKILWCSPFFVENIDGLFGPLGMDRLIGGIVTRAGPTANDAISRTAPDLLAHLDLRPVFVGVDRDLLRAAVEGDASSLRDALVRPMSFSDEARGDHARGWIIPLGEEM